MFLSPLTDGGFKIKDCESLTGGKHGSAWLDNFGIRVDEHPHLVDVALGVLLLYSVMLLFFTYITLAYVRRYVK